MYTAPFSRPAPVAALRAAARLAHRLAHHLVSGAFVLAACIVLASTSATVRADTPLDEIDPAAIEALRTGRAVVLMRHALAPGTGDPSDFERGDCATQRNLSAAGRTQAAAIGERLATLFDGQEAEVYSSAWCRCLDTARLLDVGPLEPLPALDSFFRERDRQGARTEALEAWIASRLAADPARPPAVLVTHQVNVTALTGEFVASGEALVVTETGGRARVLATIDTDPPAASGQ